MADDRCFQHFRPRPPILDGGDAHSACPEDEAYLDGGLSYRSLLAYGSSDPTAETRNPLKMRRTEPIFGAVDDVVISVEAQPYSFFCDAMPPRLPGRLPSLLSYEHPQSSATIDDSVLSCESPPYNFFSDETPHPLPHRLPSLLSYERPQIPAAVVDRSRFPNPRYDETSPHGNHHQQQRCNRRQQPPHHQKKQRLSDMTRRLQKLLPWDDKMDMATVLEEAYKYIKFLQAQVSVLQSMPRESSASSAAAHGGGELGSLSRQQLLQVAVNSPEVQTQLYSKGCCLYSVEQLMLLKNKAERHHQIMFDSSTNPNSYLH